VIIGLDHGYPCTHGSELPDVRRFHTSGRFGNRLEFRQA